MKNIIALNNEIEKIVNPEVEFDFQQRNILFFGNWVNEINSDFFEKWESRIKEKIIDLADLGNPMKLKILRVFHQDVLKKYNDLINLNFNDLDYLKSQLSVYNRNSKTNKPRFNPKLKPKDFYYSPDSDFEENLQRFAEINNITDFDFYDGTKSPDEYKDYLEDEVLYRLNLLNEDSKAQDNKLNELYSYVYLSFCIDASLYLLKNIAGYLDNCVNLIEKAENFEIDKYSFDEISDNDPTNLKLEFKVNKFGVTFFYKTLFEAGIINVDSKNQKYNDTNLIKYLDGANIYFLNSQGKSVKVKGVGKQFSKIKSIDGEYNRQEIELLDLIISKFSDRREKILESI